MSREGGEDSAKQLHRLAILHVEMKNTHDQFSKNLRIDFR